MVSTAYQSEVIQRQQEIIRALQNELDWERRLFSNPTLKPPDKLIIWKTTPAEVKRGQAVEQAKEQKLYITGLAKDVGISSDTFSSRLQRIAETTQALTHRREREPAQDGTPVWRVYVAPTPVLTAPEKIDLPQVEEGHGGKRIKGRRKCKACGSYHLVETRQVVCADCGVAQDEKTIHLVNPPEDEARPQDDTSLEDEEQKNFCEPDRNLPDIDGPITPPILAQDSLPAVEVEQSTKFVDLPDRKMTPGDFPLDWLQMRIGDVPHKLIKATGQLEASKKYISLSEGYTPDLAAYLRGELEHIYGSNLRNTDGTTQVLSFDIDTTERALRKYDYLRLLSNAGAAPIYWSRRPGRAHLELYFDAPVDAQAAYEWAISVCPLLAEFEECYPVQGNEDKRKQRLSWPLWYRVDNQVMECAAVAMRPGADKPIHCAGIKSDPEGLRAIVAQAVIPAALIPEPIVTQASDETPTPAGWLLEKCAPRCTAGFFDIDVAKAAIRAWNEAHSWQEIVDVHNGRFLASWRGERTPSVVIDADGYYACDYGNHGQWPKKVDRFEAWCLVNGLDRRAEKERLCIAYRERLS